MANDGWVADPSKWTVVKEDGTKQPFTEYAAGLKSGAALRLERPLRGVDAWVDASLAEHAAGQVFSVDRTPQPKSPAAQLAQEAELRQMLADADAPPRSLWRRLRGAWDGMRAEWRGEAWWQE